MSATTDAMIQAALQIYNNQHGNKTPNFYEVPPTESEKWLLDRQKELYNYSPARDYISSYADQWLKGLNMNPENFKFMSGELSGQPFAGGIKMPTIDFSKMPQYWKDPAAGKKPGTPADNFQGNSPNGSPVDRGPRTNIGGDPTGNMGFGDDIYGALTRNNPRTPAGNVYGDEFPGSPRRAPTTVGAPDNGGEDNMFLNLPPEQSSLARTLADKASAYLRSNPNVGWDVASAGLAAIFGPMGALAGKFAHWAWNNLRPGAAPAPSGGAGAH